MKRSFKIITENLNFLAYDPPIKVDGDFVRIDIFGFTLNSVKSYSFCRKTNCLTLDFTGPRSEELSVPFNFVDNFAW